MKLTVVVLVLSSVLFVYITLPRVKSTQENSNFTHRTLPELSVTDFFITRRAGRKINMTKLIMEYSLICPVGDSCGVDFDNRYLLNLEKDLNDDCSRCTCDYRCVKNGTCCPGSYHGYMYNACVNTMLYPKDEKLLYYMVAKCSDMYNGNQTISELCKTETDPCTSVESKLIYKNQHCALCNEEINCIPWEIKLVCLNFKDFERSMSSFTSIAQMQKALDIFDCKIQLTRVEQSVEALVCTRKDYLHDDLVSICNITGLWVSYNEDISWACENFGNPYKGFRNVFCYICNPSRANEQNVALTEDCLLPEDNNELSILHNACKTFPTSNRLAPFKNIYCYSACNKEQSIETDTTENRRLLNISESNDDTLRSELNISIMYSGENKFIEMKRFVNELLPGLSADLKLYIPSLQTGKVDAYSSYISNLVNEYSSVCGMETVCNSSKNEDTPIYGNPVCGECTCNAECAESENCCPDILLNQQPYSCLGAKMFPVLYKVVTNRMVEFYESSNETYRITDVCLRNDTEEELSHNCSSYQKASDFFTNIPVTTDTGNTYRNIYCFICNSNKNDAILQFQVFCDTCIEYGLFTNINNLLDMIKSHCSKISFVPVQGKSCRETYNLTIAGYSGGEKYVRKKTSPSKFKQVEQKTIDAEDLYKPVKKVYAACNRTDKLHASHNLIEQVCESNNVNILALPEYRLEKKVYKNFACFICNPETDAIEIGQYNMTSECLLNNSVEWYVYNWRLEILCNTTKPSPRWYPYKNMYCSECNLPPWELVEVHVNPNDIEVDLQPYKYIFSISRTDFENLERASDKNIITDCPGGIYDRSRARCQLLYCSGGFQLVNKSCKPIIESPPRQLYNISFSLKYQTEQDKCIYKTPLIVKLKDICTRMGEMITNTFEKTTVHFIQSGTCMTSSCLPRKQTTHSIINDMFVNITRTTIISVLFSIGISYTKSISAVHTSLLKALNQSFVITDIPDINEESRTFRLYSHNAVNVSVVLSDNFCKFIYPSLMQFEQDPIYSQYNVDKYLTCPHIKFHLNQTIINDTTEDLYIKEDNITFNVNDYKIKGNFAIICLKDFIKNSPLDKIIPNEPYLLSALGSFTFACSVISLACLFMTFITYCIFPSLRTIPGKNIMTLCIFLFCSQCFLQFGINLPNETKLCIAVGMCNHFCWLASFCVMNVCSFHMFKLFCVNNFTRSVASIQQQRSLFLKYLSYIVCLPLILVLVTVSVNLTLYENIGYGRHYCFISGFYIFIGTFLTPACLIFVSNIIFFSIAFHKIRSSPTVQSTQNRNNFFVCLRLCTIVGMTWPLIIVDNVVNLYWFSFFVYALNALQGCFIFFSFVVNKRVYSLFFSSVRNMYMNHSANTERSGTD